MRRDRVLACATRRLKTRGETWDLHQRDTGVTGAGLEVTAAGRQGEGKCQPVT